MRTAVSLLIAFAVIIFHYWACRRPSKYWYVGGTIPLVWSILLSVLSFNGMMNWPEDWKLILFPAVIIFLMWTEGHQAARKKEIVKMKARDLE